MAPPSDVLARYGRQILLGEVGREGQARVLGASAAVSGEGLAHRVAERYARRAGFAAITPGSIDVDALCPRDIAEHTAARELVAGARAALAEFRAAALLKARP